MRIALFCFTCVAAFGVTGCKNGEFALKRWGGGPSGQGTVEEQTARAAVYDPYPMNDTGPEIVGARPRGFTNPLSEPYRNEMKATRPSSWSQYPNP